MKLKKKKSKLEESWNNFAGVFKNIKTGEMMKHNLDKLFKRLLMGTLICLAIPSLVYAESNGSTKPKGAVGSGSIGEGTPKPMSFWWPDRLDLGQLRDHDSRSNPFGENYNYADEFKKINLDALKKDINFLLTDSQEWWPADWGNYGPLFIRLAWHASGTYRTYDGRGGVDGGQQRFEPLNSWPDNAGLDKARRLLWPIKQKYGKRLSWADLFILSGNVALENMGFDTYGFAAGRTDDWEADLTYWGPEVEMLASEREDSDGKLKKPLGSAHMGLIYVNPEGPKGKPDPLASAKNIRITFERMAMNDEETVALIAGGHTFGKMHGARKPQNCLGREPVAADIEEQGLGWKNKCGKGHSEDATSSGIEGAWTQLPTKWTSLYLENLLNLEWRQTKSPAGAIQWIPTDANMHKLVPDAHIKGKYNPPVMTTADLALKYDPKYRKISERFLADPDLYQQAFAKAWFKLTHRDLGPRALYLGSDYPQEMQIWQDPISTVNHKLISERDIKNLKKQISNSELTVPQLVRAAWSSAASYRASDKRGGSNGGRIALLPQINWKVNSPNELNTVIEKLRTIQKDFNKKAKRGKRVSLADVVVLGGAVAIELAADKAGIKVKVPYAPGRGDALPSQTDTQSFEFLELHADAFRNYFDQQQNYRSPTELMVDRADQLSLTVPQMTVLIGGLRSLDANVDGIRHGVLTDRPGILTNDFFVNLLNMDTKWRLSGQAGVYEGLNRATGKKKFTATSVDLIFGSNSELRAVAEVYAFDGAEEKFVNDFILAWVKVMRLGVFN